MVLIAFQSRSLYDMMTAFSLVVVVDVEDGEKKKKG